MLPTTTAEANKRKTPHEAYRIWFVRAIALSPVRTTNSVALLSWVLPRPYRTVMLNADLHVLTLSGLYCWLHEQVDEERQEADLARAFGARLFCGVCVSASNVIGYYGI